ncbi:pseudouridine synthase, partial [Mycobacterium tuberculosis]
GARRHEGADRREGAREEREQRGAGRQGEAAGSSQAGREGEEAATNPEGRPGAGRQNRRRGTHAERAEEARPRRWL